MGSLSARGRVLVRVLLLVILAVAATCTARWVFRSEEERVSEMIDDARDALVEGRGEDFLAYFDDGLRYRDHGDKGALRADLARWEASGLRQVIVVSREVRVVGESAWIDLEVAVGAGLYDLGSVRCAIRARRTDDGWRATEFAWR